MPDVVINDIRWRVSRAAPGDPRLVDRQGKRCLATTDPGTRLVLISQDVVGDMLGKVIRHEMCHAVMSSYGLEGWIGSLVDRNANIGVEEWICDFVSEYGETVSEAASIVISEIDGRKQ